MSSILPTMVPCLDKVLKHRHQLRLDQLLVLQNLRHLM